jgi:hypothetical protein
VRPAFVLLLPLAGGCTFLLPSLQTPPPCPVGTVLCNNLTCSDLRTDPFNCSFCENVCGQGLSCKLIPDGGPLDAGTLDGGLPPPSAFACLCTIPGSIFSNGSCYDLASDPSNCGGIGSSCGTAQVCVDGSCGSAGGGDGGTGDGGLSDGGDGGLADAGDGGLADAGDGGLSDGGDGGLADAGDGGPGDAGDGGDGGP